MIIILAIFVLIIAIAVLAIKYFLTYARLTSHKSMDTAAKRRAQALKFMDPVITCDFCGATIDTSVHNCCPNCGASYDQDQEWLDKFKTDPKWINENAEKIYEEEVNLTKMRAEHTAKLLKRLMLVLACIILLLLGLYAFITLTGANEYYTKNQKLNEYSFDNYVAADYDIEGSPVIIDNEYARVTVEGIYEDSSRDAVKIGYKLENLTDKDIRVRFDLLAVNKVVDDSNGGFNYHHLRKNSSVTVYDDMRGDQTHIKELIYGYIKVSVDDDTSEISGNEHVYITTNLQTEDGEKADVVIEENSPLVYDDHGVKIYLTKRGFEAKDNLTIINESGHDFVVDTGKCMVKGKEEDTSIIFRKEIPRDCTYISQEIYAYDSDGKRTEGKNKIKLSLSFKCTDDPSQDFSTGLF